ncbi:hypothetical protein EVAR_72288_1 [Eumeta japonica]|uniref:Uncharacterized protein n=1 Tax=Eumeta variegata TaxID=151549 RepID=A0A4C1T363_EUMVA|nr:hypothetical protein EVAR_72288_1 [Eumeta japonica]
MNACDDDDDVGKVVLLNWYPQMFQSLPDADYKTPEEPKIANIQRLERLLAILTWQSFAWVSNLSGIDFLALLLCGGNG